MERRAGGSAEGPGAAAQRAARGAPRRPPAAGGDGVHDHGLRATHGQHQHPRRHDPDAGPLLAADALIGSSASQSTGDCLVLRIYTTAPYVRVRSLFGIGREKKPEGEGIGRSCSSPLARVLYPCACGVRCTCSCAWLIEVGTVSGSGVLCLVRCQR